MTQWELTERFAVLMHRNPPNGEIERLFKKALQSGALDIENELPDDYRLPKIIYYTILCTMAEEWKPLIEENRKEAENLKRFL